MNEQLRALLLSLGIHTGLVLAAAGLGGGLTPAPPPAVLDLSLLTSQAPAARPLHPRARPRHGAAPRERREDPEKVRPQVQRADIKQEPPSAAVPSGPPPEEAAQDPGQPEEALRQVYLSRNYSGIREKINAGLVYPDTARRMGWSGKVVVSFVVLKDGEVRDVRVREGCGHDLLDRSAVETVKRCAPYPAPPAEAEVLVPITYRLE